MPKLTIDGKEVTVPKGTNLIEAGKLTGAKIPHYCYHRKLSIAGNCRICLVDIEKNPKLQIACNTKAAEGMVVHTNTPKVIEGRQCVMEFILVNHPIDCPVCDQAGECKLQEYYMKHDLKPSRMEEEKVHKEKATPLGPNVMLDMERCILCSRCIRFCNEIAKEDELCFTQRGDHTELTTYPGKELSNPYSVNTVDICPVGALTSRDFRFKQRVWFLKETESICPGCSTGCNIKVNHNQGVIYRLLPRNNEQVNECWMCDEGRMTYKPVNQENRLRHPRVKMDGQWQNLRKETAISKLQKILEEVNPSTILGIGSAQFTNEDNFSLQGFLKALGAYDIAYQAKEAPNPSHDDFLISADKNPNRAGVTTLGMKPISTFAKGQGYQVFFVLGEIEKGVLDKLASRKDYKMILFASHENTSSTADLILPVPLWAEEEGTFTNKQNRVQRIHEAFPPPGESLPVWQWVSFIAKALDKEKPQYTHINQVFADLSETVSPFKGMNYDKIGKEGLLLASS